MIIKGTYIEHKFLWGQEEIKVKINHTVHNYIIVVVTGRMGTSSRRTQQTKYNPKSINPTYKIYVTVGTKISMQRLEQATDNIILSS